MITISLSNYNPTGNKFYNWLRSWLPDGDVYDRTPLAVPYIKDPIKVIIQTSGIGSSTVILVHKWIEGDDQISENISVRLVTNPVEACITLRPGFNTVYAVWDNESSNMIRINAYYIHYFLYLYALEFLSLRQKTVQSMQNLHLDNSFGDDKTSWLWSGVSNYSAEEDALTNRYLNMLQIGKPIGYTYDEIVTLIKNLIFAYRFGGTEYAYRMLADAFGVYFTSIVGEDMNRNLIQPTLATVESVSEVGGDTYIYLVDRNYVVDYYKNYTVEVYQGTPTYKAGNIKSNGYNYIVIEGTGLGFSAGDKIIIYTSQIGVVKGQNYPIVSTAATRYISHGHLEIAYKRERIRKYKESLLMNPNSTLWLYTEINDVDSNGYNFISKSSTQPERRILTKSEAFTAADIKTDTDGSVTGVVGFKYIELSSPPIEIVSVADLGTWDPTKEFDCSNYRLIKGTRFLSLGSNRVVVNDIGVGYKYWKDPIIIARIKTNPTNITDITFGSMLISNADQYRTQGMLLLSRGAMKYLTEIYFDDIDVSKTDNGTIGAGSGGNIIYCLGKSWEINKWVGGQIRVYNPINDAVKNWTANVIGSTSNTITLDRNLDPLINIGFDKFSVIDARKYYERTTILELAKKLLPVHKQAYFMFRKESDENELGSYYVNYFYMDKLAK